MLVKKLLILESSYQFEADKNTFLNRRIQEHQRQVLKEFTAGLKPKALAEKLDNRTKSMKKLDKIMKNRNTILSQADYFKFPEFIDKSSISVPSDFSSTSGSKLDTDLLASTDRMMVVKKRTRENEKVKMKEKLESLLQGLNSKEVADVLMTPNLLTFTKYAINVNQTEVLQSDSDSEVSVQEEKESNETKQEIEVTFNITCKTYKVSRFHQKIRRSTMVQTRLRDKIDRQGEELARIYNM
jgi:hypothetical protein